MRQPVPFGKYLLLDRISVGGMAEVFKAKSYGVEGFEKIIAIKRILPTMGEDRDFIKMFIDEAKIAGQLAHANICQIFELGRIDGSHFIAMEYIWGKDLLQIQNRLRKNKTPMPVAMACFTIAKVLEGLDYAHRKRDPLGRPLEIVHRDCSPQNVLVSYEGEVKVIDFGIAKATSRNSRTMAGVLKGKFGYMSPEQVRGLPLDRRSDLFALGTMLYECLTSERLFQGETDFSTLEKVRNVDIQRPRDINPNIPESVERVILKALAKDVDDRYQWCSEMLADLQQYLMGQDVVFTAKSLSGWLKDVFSPEIERERQQLEQYKRVGRDGLIAGVPAAEAKLDVVATLGEAGAPEGDPTMLGEPQFEDLEAAVAAAGVGPALGSPAARGRDDDDHNDFGEEAPTEIFGEIDQPGAVPTPAVAPPAVQRAPTGQPSKQPPRPPPTRPPTNRPSDSAYPPMAAGGNGAGMMAPPGPVSPASGFSAQSYAQPGPGMGPGMDRHGHGHTPAPSTHGAGNTPMPIGTPGGMPAQPLNAIPPPGAPGQAKTLLGAAAPVGLPNYSGGYPQQMSGQQAAVYPGYPPQGQHPSQPQLPGMPPMTPPGPQTPPGSMPGVGPMAQTPSGAMPGLGSQPMQAQPQMYPSHGQMPAYPLAQQMPGYGQSQGPYQPGPANALEPALPPEGRKRSSIGRDVAIGVAIAGLVLGGFLAVKFLVLDASDEPEGSIATAASSYAKLRISMPNGPSAELYVDNKRFATVADNQEIEVAAGQRELKLVGLNGQQCKQEIQLPADVVTTIECKMDGGSGGTTPAGGSGSSADAAGSGSSAVGSAGSAVVGSGSGSDVIATVDKAAADKAAADKIAADKIAADKIAADKIAADKIAADKIAADKTAADKVAADKTAADKVAADKAKLAADKAKLAADKTKLAADKAKLAADKAKLAADKTKRPGDKMPAEDNPADKAGTTPTKGWVQLTSKPSAKILVDGVDSGLSTPITGRALSLAPGKHKITFQIGGDKYTFTVNVKAGETVLLDKQLQ